jgi:hypothetical protein
MFTMRRQASLVLAVITLLFSGGMTEAAQRRAGSSGPAGMLPSDSSLVGLHELRREGGRVCMIEHTHVGTSGTHPSRKAAELAAQRDWANFTAWEYGNHWGSTVLAGSKTMRCEGGGASYSCEFEARPCRH